MDNPFTQTNLYGLENQFNSLKVLYDNKKLPNKILFVGEKGLGKFTLSLHLINYILSKGEDNCYDIENFKINENNTSYKLVKNNSSPNLYLIDLLKDKKNIEIDQIRELISFCNKTSLNNKPRFILIDNLELMTLNSNNALLRTLEEPNNDIYFILISNSRKILPTISSRCLKFNINLTQKECLNIFNKITNIHINDLINSELISYYFSTGDLLNLYRFSIDNSIDLSKLSLKELLLKIIDENFYKKESISKNLIYAFIQMYFLKNLNIEINYETYVKIINSIENVKKYNLDIESFFIQLRHQLIND
ncbi:DNA polymerase III [Candidatus Pelagibacter sp.]|nr:DNA polymerase III [Candidatus Pelagibacter sp.]